MEPLRWARTLSEISRGKPFSAQVRVSFPHLPATAPAPVAGACRASPGLQLLHDLDGCAWPARLRRSFDIALRRPHRCIIFKRVSYKGIFEDQDVSVAASIRLWDVRSHGHVGSCGSIVPSHKDKEKAKGRRDHYAEVTRDGPSESWVRSLAILRAERTMVQSRLAISSVQAIYKPTRL
jgi:hypothetical protein